MKKGFFVSFEGLDGSGKTTQIRMLEKRLISEGKSVKLTKEPGGTVLGENIRNLLLNPELKETPSPLAEIFLFMADRAQNTGIIIKKAINDGNFVISDRYIDSTMAYQGYGRGIDLELINTLNRIAAAGILPDITFFLDISIEESKRRVLSGKKEFSGIDRMEKERAEFHQKVRKGFLELAVKNNQRIKVIDSCRNIEEIHKDIYKNLIDKIEEKKLV
ncbi:MAG: dTMP kinase [Spirochaetes bacterium]|nr:dTMP kinase [Spirochaetota bacterium]MCK5267585.1 dTMP kinase [Spirochaetota bacterium]